MSDKLRVAVIGPKGQAGSCIVDELLARGHHVTGISRSPPKQVAGAKEGQYSSVAIDIFREYARLSEVFSSNFDAIVCAFGPNLADLDNVYLNTVEAHARIKTALLASDHEGPFIIIGGAGSLHAANREQLVDQDGFAYSWWWDWPEEQIDYLKERASDHGNKGISRIIGLFKWVRGHIKTPRSYSWILSPITYPLRNKIRNLLVSTRVTGLIQGSRIAYNMWTGVTEKSWSFLSPPGLLRDKGIRTGKYKVLLDSATDPAVEAVEGGIYNEDMAVAIVDEVERDELAFKHWTCVGEIGLGRW